MNAFVLVVFVYLNEPALTAVQFDTQQLCEAAKAQVESKFDTLGGGVRAVCVQTK